MKRECIAKDYTKEKELLSFFVVSDLLTGTYSLVGINPSNPIKAYTSKTFSVN